MLWPVMKRSLRLLFWKRSEETNSKGREFVLENLGIKGKSRQACTQQDMQGGGKTENKAHWAPGQIGCGGERKSNPG